MASSVLNVLVYSFHAHWMWGDQGWLKSLGAVDLTGAIVVHAAGGFAGAGRFISRLALDT